MIKTQVIQKEDFTLAANHKLKFANVKNMTLPKIAPRSIPENIVQSDTLGTEGKQQHISIEKDPKFKKAINSFDQILQDFISAKEEKISKIPKLQKSKTCCVIESKCIYKRTLSLPNGHCENLKSKTKSLLDLNQEEMREYSAKPHGFKNDNVKSTIQKFNQLTATQKNITIHDSDRVPKKISKSLSLNDKIYSSDSPFRQKNANNKLSRSISSNSEQNEEKRNMSRIPVNTNLRRSFPSTPLGLNKLDQQNGSHVFKETELHSKFSKSVQNLSRSSALSMAKSTGLSSRNGGSTYDLSKSVQNLSKCSPKMSSSRMSISKNNPDIFKSVQNLSRYSKTSMIKTNLTQTKLSSNLSKSVHNINKNYSKSPVGKSAKLGGNSSSGLSKSVSNLSRTPPKISKYTNIAGSKYNEHSKSSTNLEKISLKRSVSKSTGLLSKSTQNLSKNSQSKVFVESSTPTKIRRDFVNSSLKNSQDFQMDNAEAKIVEMKKVIEAKIDQQLKELSLDETDFQITGNVKSKIEQFSKNKEHRELSEECFIALKCPKDAEVQSVTKKYTDIESIQHKTVNLKKSDTFKKKISTFSKPPLVKKEIRDTYDEKLPPKVTPRIKNTFSKKNSIDNIESKHSSIELTIPHGDQNVFGVKKQSAEPKFIENTAKKLIQLRKNSFSKNTYDINLNIKNVKEFSKMMTAKEKALNGWVDSDNLNSKVDRVIYGSDDSSSDDSGNISTEIENDECSSPVEVESKNLDIPGVKQEQVFLRNGILSQLEAQRDECLGGMVVKLQARCRGYLARNKLSQRKLQDLAVRCIQRNVRKFMLVRDWPWWRLLVRVTPLLNVHRTEEKLKLKTVSTKTININSSSI
ncbi:hypothetical protein HHI36_022240 [Cryptolaemus montrouzieri]|uniref:Uncharacterized protein n=1 Tax=Cryptolaemus montrouzieri TaxID=559131 RepID=A0ABD2MZ80_9CUCU